ncbi:MAG: ATP-binding protein [Candidatus Omnitrophica bacterium]|nr:ATP-binding protein [Candidatus Omnitrophota bacterium]MCK5083198.1 ATP-binding protein [Candidatus Omnitrophota bacterium]MCK5178070.1 ATP-binding protein [Candidatus Omnitrophota bacterium]
MKQIVVISGKGGTGKTVMTGALAALAENKIMVDCDVDAANLHLILKPEIKEKHTFRGGKGARIDKDLCGECGQCRDVCRFDAISEDYVVDPISCEGCCFCGFVCPLGAMKIEERVSGEWFFSDTKYGPFVHAKLGIAEDNSGRLVALIKEKAKEIAKEQRLDWMIIDGAPGIGCPVIASLSGVHCALVVTEPTLSGLHDAERVVKVARQFGADVKMVVNKYDLNKDMTAKIETYCRENDVQLIGKIGFDEQVVRAVVQGKTIMDCPDGKTKDEVVRIWEILRESVK